MPYEVIAPESVDILVSYGEVKDPATGVVLGHDQGSNVWFPGEVIPEDQVHPYVKKQYKDGDNHIRSLIKKVSERQVKAEAADDDGDDADDSAVNPSVAEESARSQHSVERGDQGSEGEATRNDEGTKSKKRGGAS
jgi:hypothetical protein